MTRARNGMVYSGDVSSRDVTMRSPSNPGLKSQHGHAETRLHVYRSTPHGGVGGTVPGHGVRAKLTPLTHTLYISPPPLDDVARRTSFSVVAPVCRSVSPFRSLSALLIPSLFPSLSLYLPFLFFRPFTTLQQTSGIAS